MKKIKYNIICSYICAILMLILLIAQFMPFWDCVGCRTCEDEVASVSDYVWFPNSHKPLDKVFSEIFGKKFMADQVVVVPVIMLVFSFVGVFLCTILAQNSLVGFVPFIVGLAGVYGYQTNPALAMGKNATEQLVLSGILLVFSICVLSRKVVDGIIWLRHRR